MKHTPEPWAPFGKVHECTISGHTVIRDYLDTPIAYVAYMDDANRIANCVNACAGIENPEEAIREARETLFKIMSLQYSPYRIDDTVVADKSYILAEKALAKLQPKQVE